MTDASARKQADLTPKSNGMRKHGERRREIVRVAKCLFADNGFDGTSIRDISDAVGILPGSIYHHFKAKEEMLDEIVSEYANHLLAAYRKALAESPDAYASLQALIRAGILSLIERREEHTIMVREFSYLGRTASEEKIWREIYSLWLGVIKDGIKSGIFRKDINPQIIFRIIINSINSTIAWYRSTGPFKLEEMMDGQIKLFMEGIRA